jgi:tRNA uridine 5-carboxymethylaminomethyl modification enzyme
MWHYPHHFDVIVIGAGHAGCEAAHAAARMGASTLLLTLSLDNIGKMSCNPAIGGTAKGHIVREIDALGGIMGKIADRTAIHYRMLNASKGPAVWSPRAQNDRFAYQSVMKEFLEQLPNLSIVQGSIESLVIENQKIAGVRTLDGIEFRGKTVIVSSGTFMRGLLHIGNIHYPGGRAGDKPSIGLSHDLDKLGFKLGRLKTGTPPRIYRRSIDFSHLEEQPSESNVRFSHDEEEFAPLKHVSCHITYTTEETQKIVLDNLHCSSLYSGRIEGTPTRYCPSIEDKMVRFATKKRHQIFLEPEGLNTEETYVNGISSSLPCEVQLKMLRSVIGLENAEIMRIGYAIEYDYVCSGHLNATLETKSIEGLYFAGQINGTTGYEEAAGQGIIAGINAANKVLGRPPFILKRSESYIGVLIDELITKDLDEPYRMFTSRAEHRLLLRQDNCDLRLRHYGYELGLISAEQFAALEEKKRKIKETIALLEKKYLQYQGKSTNLVQLLCRPEFNYSMLLDLERSIDHGPSINRQIELQVKYAGYIKRQEKIVEELSTVENYLIPPDIDFLSVAGICNEAKEKLNRLKPSTLGQASRISGISPADISVLLVMLKNRGCEQTDV